MKKNLKPLLRHSLLCLLILFSCSIYAQQNPQVIPPSPVTQEFNKYINYNVSYYNGLPDITIPLYTINIKGVSVPINLSYHASGIKFGQDHTETGLGWTINPGYRISRTMYGFADELETKPPNLADSLSDHSTNPDKKYTDRFLAKFLEPATDRPSAASIYTQFDGEYDIFNFSTPADGGSFIINDRTSKTISNIEYSNLKTEYKTGTSSDGFTHGIIGLRIKDTNGNKFSYGEWNARNGNFVFEANTGIYGGYVPSAWAITDINNPFGDNIHFNYSAQSTNGWSNGSKSITFSEEVKYDIAENFIPSSIGDISAPIDIGYTTFALDSIVSANEKVVFTRPVTAYGHQVSEINVYAKDNSLIKKINFYYSGGAYFLDSVIVSGTGSVIPEVYRFEYYDKSTDFGTSVLVPDQWGYNMLAANNYKIFHEEFADDEIFITMGEDPATDYGGSNSPREIGIFLPDYTDRSHLSVAPQYFSLKKIIYPTGGSTTYEYELNKINSTENGGGIRIKKISSNDLSGETLVRRFAYGAGENGYGTPTVYLTPEMFVDEKIHFVFGAVTNILGAGRIITYSSSLLGDLGSGGFLSDNIVYPEVTEYYTSSGNGNGKTVYNYNLGNQYSINSMQATFIPGHSGTPSTMQYHSYSPVYVTDYKQWNKPTLTKKTSYSESGGVFTKIKKEAYSYSTAFQSYEGLKVRPFASSSSYNFAVSGYYTYFSSFFNYSLYNIRTGLNQLTGKDEIEYYAADSIKLSTQYTYNTLKQLTNESMVNSKGQTVEKVKKYPYDMVSSSSDPTGIYQAMIDSNVVEPAVEDAVLNTSVEVSKIKTNYYAPNTGQFLPQSIQVKNLTTSTLENKLLYHNYDVSGNPLSLSQAGGAKICYIWSYKGKYPVAEVKNADYASVVTALGSTNITNFKNLSNPTKATIDTFIATLKTALPNAQITTYSYKPLNGIASATDPKGITTYYEYDGFQRLKTIKDDNGDIVKTIDYNFGHTPKYNTARSVNYTKNDCISGTGSSVTYTVAANTYSAYTVADANALRDADITANGQAYANAHGSCVSNASVDIDIDVSPSNTFSVNFHNTATNADYTYVLASGFVTKTFPQGTYVVTVVGTDPGNTTFYTATIFGQDLVFRKAVVATWDPTAMTSSYTLTIR